MDYEDSPVNEMVIHPTGQQSVMVPTFGGARPYEPHDLRPYPAQVDERVGALAAQLDMLRQEMTILQAQVATLEAWRGNQ